MLNTLSQLFSLIQIGPYTLGHRVVMAPLTRLRSENAGDVPGDLMLEYYTQRASEGGLIVAEATTISKTARGYLGAPGIYTPEQVDGWRRITEAVHAQGGRIVLQLWHVGRASHIEMTGGVMPVSASVNEYDEKVFTSQGWVSPSPHRALEVEEVPALLEDYRLAAINAQAAGFDGIEVHGGNGYLLDQFLQNGSNKRTDEYGGSVENRARLLLQVVETLVTVWAPAQVGVRISPNTRFNAMSDTNPEKLFGYLAEQLNRFGLAWLHIIEPRVSGNATIEAEASPIAAEQIRQIFQGHILAAGGFEPESAAAILQKGDADLVAFGRHFIANPDLPRRIRDGLPLHAYDRSTFYGGDSHGYTDYPTYEAEFSAL